MRSHADEQKGHDTIMVEPGSVRAGDELLYEFGNIPACKKIVKIGRITTRDDDAIAIGNTIYREGIIVLESGALFMPDGMAFSARNNELESGAFHPFTPELHPLTPELRKEIELQGPWC